jgi:SAM-dependent methyltransferase
MQTQAHWDGVYATTAEDAVSWYTPDPRLPLDLITEVAPSGDRRIIDVGGGASVLVDRLLDRGYEHVAVLDISGVALERAKSRLDDRAGRVQWIVADVTGVEDVGPFDVWHDRAVFQFLTASEERRRYVELAKRTVPSGGHVIISTFALTGPSQCSGLPVCRYDASMLAAELGEGFILLRQLPETHRTPSGKTQEFIYTVFKRRTAEH